MGRVRTTFVGLECHNAAVQLSWVYDRPGTDFPKLTFNQIEINLTTRQGSIVVVYMETRRYVAPNERVTNAPATRERGRVEIQKLGRTSLGHPTGMCPIIDCSTKGLISNRLHRPGCRTKPSHAKHQSHTGQDRTPWIGFKMDHSTMESRHAKVVRDFFSDDVPLPINRIRVGQKL